jgi:staphylococcal nuclease domain-containing protein 1
LAVGKTISFTTTHSLPPKDDVLSDFGHAEIDGKDVATEVLRAGFARCKEIKREPTDEDTRRKELETEARNNMVGMWNPQGPKVSGNGHDIPWVWG